MDVWSPINNGINMDKPPINWCSISQPSTVWTRVPESDWRVGSERRLCSVSHCSNCSNCGWVAARCVIKRASWWLVVGKILGKSGLATHRPPVYPNDWRNMMNLQLVILHSFWRVSFWLENSPQWIRMFLVPLVPSMSGILLNYIQCHIIYIYIIYNIYIYTCLFLDIHYIDITIDTWDILWFSPELRCTPK